MWCDRDARGTWGADAGTVLYPWSIQGGMEDGESRGKGLTNECVRKINGRGRHERKSTEEGRGEEVGRRGGGPRTYAGKEGLGSCAIDEKVRTDPRYSERTGLECIVIGVGWRGAAWGGG